MASQTETFQFQAESRKLLDLMIHSIYTNKEIFLRELISNASDALDKLRVESLTRPDLLQAGETLEIRLEADPEKKTLSIIDNGIGMSREDLVNHIGTIARSGTQEFVSKIKDSKADASVSELIGQFGVGFYSAFMAADKIVIETRKAGTTEAYRWESTGDGEFSITPISKDKQGSVITLYLKPEDPENGLEDFTDFYTVSSVVKKYSDFINYPIMMKQEREEIEKDDEGKPKKDGKKTKVIEDKTLNSMKPIWMRPQSEVTPEEYKEFYKHISHDWNEPLKTIVYKAEGTLEFYSILFVPSKAPFDFYYQGHKAGLELFVKKVMIMEAFEDLLPKYLRFMKGVVESSDLSLNISREMLQQNRSVTMMKKSLTKKTLDSLADLFNNERDQYLTFWKEFGNALKDGVISDHDNREKVSGLLLFESTADPSKLTSIDEYIDRMKEGQTEIYFLTAENRLVADNSPHLEALKEKGYEVLFLLSPIDEILTQYLNEYKGKKLKSISKGNLDLGSKEEKEQKEKETKEKSEEMGDLLKFLKEKLEKNIKEVKVSSRLVSAPACIEREEYDVTPYLEKLLNKENDMMSSLKKRVLEINPKHAVVTRLFDRYKANNNDPLLGDYAEMLMDYALLAEGAPLPDPVKFNKLVVELMERSI